MTLVLIKPDAIARGLAGAVLTRLDRLGLRVVGAKAMRVSHQLAVEHYQALRDKPFFEKLIRHLTGQLHDVDYVLAFVYTGPDAIAKVRQAAGATNPEQADPASLRGAFGRNTAEGLMENVLHASSDAREAEREITLWFRPHELLVPLYATERPTARRIGATCCRA